MGYSQKILGSQTGTNQRSLQGVVVIFKGKGGLDLIEVEKGTEGFIGWLRCWAGTVGPV